MLIQLTGIVIRYALNQANTRHTIIGSEILILSSYLGQSVQLRLLLLHVIHSSPLRLIRTILNAIVNHHWIITMSVLLLVYVWNAVIFTNWHIKIETVIVLLNLMCTHHVHYVAFSRLPHALHLFLKMITYSVFTVRASISSLKPFLDTLWVESMQAR